MAEFLGQITHRQKVAIAAKSGVHKITKMAKSGRKEDPAK
jgi:hypothetical protein